MTSSVFGRGTEKRYIYGFAQNRTAIVDYEVRLCAYCAISLLANSIEVTSVGGNAL